jgi:hypothetical protein
MEQDMTKEALRLALEALESNRRTHHYCEDTWYSCPKHEDGCANDSEGDECNCGADKANAGIDQAITAIKEALANEALDKMAENARELGLDYEPAQRTWVEIDDEDFSKALELCDFDKIAAFEFFETKLKEKNNG